MRATAAAADIQSAVTHVEMLTLMLLTDCWNAACNMTCILSNMAADNALAYWISRARSTNCD